MLKLKKGLNFIVFFYFFFYTFILVFKRRFVKLKNIKLFAADLLILLLSFLSVTIIKPGGIESYVHNYYLEVLLFIVTWFPISFIFGKYNPINSSKSFLEGLKPIINANLVILGLTSLLIVVFQISRYSRMVFFGTFSVAFFLEIVFYNFLHYFGRLKDLPIDEDALVKAMHSKNYTSETSVKEHLLNGEIDHEVLASVRSVIKEETTAEVFVQLEKWVNLSSPYCQILATTTRFNIDKSPNNKYKCFINLKRINDIRYINKFFEAVNVKLPINGIFIGCVETKDIRKFRVLKKYPFPLNYFYYTIDYIIKRIFPKFNLTKGLYFFLTHGHNRVLSKAETFGRLYSCGFEVIDEVFVNNHLYFLTRKIDSPHYDPDPTYGPLVKLNRVGKNGKLIKVYKLRTMHPYAEYLQEYIYKKSQLQEGGKFKNDFRISTLGRFFRKFWLDELPMIFNLLKGDLKIVGVRPLSKHYFSLYSPELQEKRMKTKPGLIPPFYADMPNTLEEIQESEMKYLLAFEKHSIGTDLKYFYKAMKNILFKHARSK